MTDPGAEPPAPTPAPPLPPDLLGLPTFVPPPAALADVALLVTGALPPLTGFLRAQEAAAVRTTGRLPDGTPWPAEITLAVPADVGAAAGAAGHLVLTDTESVPLALLTVTELAPEEPDGVTPQGAVRLAGPLTRLREPSRHLFAALARSPQDVRTSLPPGTVLADVVDRPPLTARLNAVRAAADGLGGAHLLLLVRTADTGPDGLPPDTLLRTVLAAAPAAPGATVVTVPLAHRPDPATDAELAAFVAAAYGATHLLAGPADGTGEAPRTELPVRIVTPEGPAGPTPGELRALLDGDAPVPPGVAPAAVAAELARWRPPPLTRGLTVLFTGLSGSGKSTVARRVADLLLESSPRRVTLLDGDEVRHLLSAGLGFSRADRNLNVRRIGWVAAEITRHGGTVLAAPIAPYAALRAEVRAMVEAGGGFVLVHVSTPLEVCEARDRKGLYAKARAGLIPEFTGISDPYEAPTDADIVLDTSVVAADDAAARVVDVLTARGYLPAAPG